MTNPTAYIEGLRDAASPGPWSADEHGSPTWHVYSEIRQDGTVGYGLFARAPDDTFPRIAWFHAVDSRMAKASKATAKLAAEAPRMADSLLLMASALDAAAKRYHLYAGPLMANVDPPHTELFKDCISPHCISYKAALASIPQEAPHE